MEFVIGNRILIKNPTDACIRWCRKNLVLDNPEFYKKQQLGKWTGNVPMQIVLYEQFGSDLLVPFGALKRLYAEFKESTWKPKFSPLKPFNYKAHINLYPYQEKAAIRALNCKNGVIVMPCGSGKTQTALEIVSRIGGRALWLTHTQDLLNQSMNRAKSVYDCEGYGTITGGKVNIGEGITFATIQTMVNLDLVKYSDCFDVVIVDECHKAIGSPTKVMQFYKVLSSLNCRYKFGLTATPKRADGLEASMFALIGDVIHKVTDAEVAHTTCPVEVKIVKTSYTPNLDLVLAGDGTVNYASLVEDITNNDDRLFDVLMEISTDSRSMVLANRVEYLHRLASAYAGKSVCLSGMGNSKKAKEERKEALRKLNDGELNCVFATYQLAKEGLDVPNLRYVIFATPEKDETTVIQAAGRVARKAEGKTHGTIIDFQDDFGMYNGWLNKRKTYYKRKGYSMVDVDYEKMEVKRDGDC